MVEIRDDEPLELPVFLDVLQSHHAYIRSQVDTALSRCTPDQLSAIANALVVPAVSNNQEQDGGGPGEITDKSQMALYEFMAMADSVHDFARRHLNVNDIVRKWCPAPMLQVFSPVFGQESNGKRKRPIHPMEIKREDVLIKHLTRPQQLRFPGHPPLPNPFYKRNLMKRYPYDPNKSIDDQARNARRGVRNQSRVISMEVWIKGDNPQSLQLEQIARVCSTIQAVLGSEVEWIVDASHEALASLVTSIPIIRESLLTRFKIDPSGSTTKFADELRSKNPSMTWTPIICDATLFDAGNLDRHVYETSQRTLGFDPAPTGEVYCKGYRHQVTLQGAEHRRDNNFYYNVAEEGVLNYLDQAHSLPVMGAAIRTTLENLSRRSISEEIAYDHVSKALAYKRAGDWGQVENCVLKGRAFMTCDKMAAMYAVMRGVSVVYLARAQHQGLLQMTFSLVKGSVPTDKSV